MAIVANVNDGVLDYSYTDNSKKEAVGSNLGYDQFLQLLCAEMQYQDPLEPTSNTEYVAQMATFSQLEATLSLQNTQQNAFASSLVGKYVILNVTDETTGISTHVDGKVDYVMYQNGEVMLSVNDRLYPLSSLDTIADASYYEAATVANTFSSMMSQFPDIDNINGNYQGALQEVRAFYDGLSSYEKSFIKNSDLQKLMALEIRVAELIGASNAANDENDAVDEAAGTEEHEDVSAVEGGENGTE